MHWPLSLNWTQGKDLPVDWLVLTSSVVINEVVYCGGNSSLSYKVIQLTPENGDWSRLPRSPVTGFAMTSLNDQLVLAGGRGDCARITVWDSGRSEWVHPYPPMSIGRELSAAVGYQKYLIVACGYPNRSDVEVLDSSSGMWYSAQPMPVGGQHLSSAVVGDSWYLSLYGDGKGHIFWAHLPTLTSSAASAHSTTEHIWHELPTHPVAKPTLLALQERLLLIGGEGYPQEIHHYDKEAREWKVCGQLPIGMGGPCCAVLPSGDLMVAGGWTGDTKAPSKRVWLANI